MAGEERFLARIENHIVQEDCIQTLKHIPSNCVDLIHTSPPYNIDKQYAGSRSDRSELNQYEHFLGETITEIKRVLRPGGSIFWQTGYTQAGSLQDGDILPIDIATYHLFREHPIRMTLWDRIIWRYWGGHAFKRKLTNKHETVLWYVKPGAQPTFNVDPIREKAKEYDKRNNFWGRNPGNVWEVDRVAYGSTDQTSHIAVFPEEISEKIVRACSNPGDLILDPFCGSGTVPKVAHGLSRRWIGIEISPVYALETSKRIGYQQPSEAESLISELIKWVAFRNKPGSLAADVIRSSMNGWASRIDLATAQKQFEDDVSLALDHRRDYGTHKKDIWVKYDNLVGASPSRNPVLLADHLLSRCYKNRRNLNGVSRYSSAIQLVTQAMAIFTGCEEISKDCILKAATQEPSSFQIDGHLITLSSLNRRIASDKSTEAANQQRLM